MNAFSRRAFTLVQQVAIRRNILLQGTIAPVRQHGLLLKKQIPSAGALRWYSSEPINGIPVVSYEEVKDLPNHPEKLLIDVREPDELKQFGQIPTSINIPLGEVEKALQLPEDKFKAQYGHSKPKPEDYVIFHCRLGRRSQTASETAAKLGFSNVHNYAGSWLEWAEKQGLPK